MRKWRATLPCNLIWFICFVYANTTIVITFPVATYDFRLQPTVLSIDSDEKSGFNKDDRTIFIKFSDYFIGIIDF